MRPDVLALTSVDGFAQLNGQVDPLWDLYGVGLLETFLDKDGVGKTPNCGRKDDPGLRIPCVGQRLIVQKYRATATPYLLPQRPRRRDRRSCGAGFRANFRSSGCQGRSRRWCLRIFPLRCRSGRQHRTGKGIQRAKFHCKVSLMETELTVWIRTGATPVFWNLVLKPLKIALVPSRWSASACDFRMRPISCRYITRAQDDPQVTYGLENDIRFRGQPLQVPDVVEGSKNSLESQLFKALSLLGRAKMDSDLVVGDFGVLGEMSEGSSSNVTWSTQASDKHSAPENRALQMVRQSTYQWHR